MKQRHFIVLLAVILSSCEFKCSVGKDADKKTQDSISGSESSSKKTSGQILNNIQINGKNISINQAYLSYESGQLVATDNTVPLGEKVVLMINSKGWKSIDKKSFLGINQVIITSTGDTVLNTGDMFAKYDETGIDSEYTGILKLKAYITETLPGIEHFKVNFRVWDKKGDGEVTGQYQFKVK